MASWKEIAREAPELAGRVRARFDAGTNKTLATVRQDGWPRISAIEVEFTDSEVTLGMMPDSVKLRDVRRDPRVALHNPTVEPPPDTEPEDWPGEAKLTGRLVPISGPTEGPTADGSFFAIDLAEVVLTHVGTPADHLVIESWHAETGSRRRTRA